MILGALRPFRSLSGYHYRTILITTILPVIGPLVIAFLAPGGLLLRVVLYVAAFLVWSLCVVLAVASMVRRDWSEAEHLVEQQIATVSGRISGLEEQHLEK